MLNWSPLCEVRDHRPLEEIFQYDSLHEKKGFLVGGGPIPEVARK